MTDAKMLSFYNQKTGENYYVAANGETIMYANLISISGVFCGRQVVEREICICRKEKWLLWERSSMNTLFEDELKILFS